MEILCCPGGKVLKLRKGGGKDPIRKGKGRGGTLTFSERRKRKEGSFPYFGRRKTLEKKREESDLSPEYENEKRKRVSSRAREEEELLRSCHRRRKRSPSSKAKWKQLLLSGPLLLRRGTVQS